MPSRADWSKLARETVHALDRQDVTDLYTVEWRQAMDELIAEHRDAIDAEPKAWKRFFRKAAAVLYGLARRLAPARRLLFAAALVLALLGPFEFSSGGRRHPEGALLTIDFHILAFGVLTLLLGMELVDKIQFRNELFLARDVQADLLPKTLPAVPPYELGAFNRIANTVGGDLYDFAPLPDGRLAVLFGDASGHGMTAGLVMAVAAATFRTQVEVDASPPVVMAALNRVLCRTGACRTGGPRQFFAGVSLLLTPDGSFSAVVAGHPPILRVDASGKVLERVGKGAYPAGIKEKTTWSLEAGTLAPGETLLLHSDGLADAQDADGREFGDARVEGVIARKAGASAAELTAALSAALADFLGRRPADDDVSIAAIRRVEEKVNG